mmetsp:Transcript_20694/g.39289  ORF Transcript_20694/g.39289 Transcript_20694/m.39289 type:complete len:83 (+) Transcript_20694:28-276(+)
MFHNGFNLNAVLRISKFDCGFDGFIKIKISVVEVDHYCRLFIILYGMSEIFDQTNYHKPRGYIADLNEKGLSEFSFHVLRST